MKSVYYERNLQTGLLDVKEFASDSQLSLLRISDPVATNLVQGYTNAELKGDKFLTPVKMPKRTGRFPAFGQEAFVISGDLKRAVGARVARLNVQSGYVTLTMDEYASGVSLENSEREEWAGAPDMLLNGRLLTNTARIRLYREKLQAEAMTTTTNYASGHYISGAGKAWGGAGTGDPVSDMYDLQELILKKNGRFCNVAFFSWGAWLKFINNTAILNRIKYGGSAISPAQMSEAAAAQLLHVDEVHVCGAVYGTPSAPGSDGGVKKSALTKAFLWDSVQSNNAGSVIRGSGSGIEPAFWYTWEHQAYPKVESYYENQTKSQIWDEQHVFNPAITANEAGAMYYSLA